MNEITKIHLGRQQFTIAVDAHHALKSYLAKIKQTVADPDVAGEVELRMAELLTERGVVGEKVILPEDVDYLKEQLGDPKDFSDEGNDASETDTNTSKRLFRDTDHAMLAGVASGLSSYFGIDAAIVRLIFVALTIFGGGVGVALYIVLWLVVPPAKSASERLQMKGKSVTLESLKHTVDQADLRKTARQANNTFLSIVNGVFGFCIKLLGIGFIAAGLSIIFGLVTTKVYMMLHNGQLFQENLFPVGIREQSLVTLAMVLGVIVAVFFILVGIACFKRKWPIRGWVTAILGGLFLLCLAASFALVADTAPQVRQRYEATLHTTAVENVTPFNKVTSSGGVDISYVSSPTYSVNLKYSGNPDLSKIKIKTKDNTLYINSSEFDESKDCTMPCQPSHSSYRYYFLAIQPP